MSWEIDTMEIIKNGEGTGRYRLVAEDDEGNLKPLCGCSGGHYSEEDAIECEVAKANAGIDD